MLFLCQCEMDILPAYYRFGNGFLCHLSSHEPCRGTDEFGKWRHHHMSWNKVPIRTNQTIHHQPMTTDDGVYSKDKTHWKRDDKESRGLVEQKEWWWNEEEEWPQRQGNVKRKRWCLQVLSLASDGVGDRTEAVATVVCTLLYSTLIYDSIQWQIYGGWIQCDRKPFSLSPLLASTS